ncbi:replication protein P [Arsenophonus nasoniae]|uniref:replication protein P n=1 Tax=Arsenophonus nasoniae TaxID=638 RepID=UPI00041CD617|nr:replication protein P [Arsenophonus nasoniae]
MQCVSAVVAKINRQQSFVDSNKNSSNPPLIKLFNRFFESLKVIFPASIVLLKTPSELAIFKQQWISGFAENNINSDRHINAGLRIARQRKSPFLPSVGQFVDWCQQGLAEEYGLPTPQQLCEKLQAYCRQRGYDDFYRFDYGSHANYWLVHELYRDMIAESLNAKQVEDRAKHLIDDLTKKLLNGYVIPKPNLSLTKKRDLKSVSKADALDRIREIKEKYGFGKIHRS